MNDMSKVVFVGTNQQGHKMFCRIKIKDGNLSITGVESPLNNGDCKGSAGQIIGSYKDRYNTIEKFSKGWSESMFGRFITIWDKWHLNNMTSHCEHIDEVAYNRTLTVEAFCWSKKYHYLKMDVTNSVDPEEVAEKAELLAKINAVLKKAGIAGYGTQGRHTWDAEIQQAFDDGWFVVDEKRTKTDMAMWVRPSEHPDGYLTRECPECGYRQGTAWLKRELPESVVEFLESLPETTITPAWV